MADMKTAGYGSWKSPVTSELVSSGAIRFSGEIEIDDGVLYWVEMRPSEAGRYVIVCRSPDGQVFDITPAPYNVRTRVHEYGGGAFIVDNGVIYFSNFDDQRLYCQKPGSSPEPLTPQGDVRYADGDVDHRRSRIICVCEDHTDNDKEPVNSLAGVCTQGKEPVQKLVSGNDFYSSPRISPDGSHLAWLIWNHPNMPWDYTELWVGEIKEDGAIRNPVLVAGGTKESICQPRYSPDGTLYFISERTGWWNLYRWRDGQVEPLCEMEAEFGSPHWVFGLSDYAFESAERLICTYVQNGISYMASLDTETLKFEILDVPYTSISSLKATSGCAVLLAGSVNETSAVVRLDLVTGESEILRRSTDIIVEHDYLSVPEAIEFSTENGLIAHALYYRPKNGEFIAPESELPPLIVISHGGPTSATSGVLSLSIQYWTSRGFAVADVNYGGSTGYGREYRQRLDGQWGIVDVDDCVNCARYLTERGEVDSERVT
ncbi:prolyl oligopeptidase family serine peptidase, partial [Chloroflexota bacterium]